MRALDEVSQRHAVSPAAVAIAQVINNSIVTAPTAIATKPAHVEAFVQAMKVKDLARLEITSGKERLIFAEFSLQSNSGNKE